MNKSLWLSACCSIASAALAAAQQEVLLVSGDAPGDQFGWSVAVIGDVNGDGRSDFAVGAPNNDATASDAGQIKLISGASHQPLWTAYGSGANARFGTAVAAAGDLDLDGRPDVIAGAPGPDFPALGLGRAFVLSGLDGSVIHTFTSPPNDRRFGAAVAGGSDIDGDSVADLLIGAPGEFPDDGAAHVYSGVNGALIRSHGAVVDDEGENVGFALSFVNDTSGDGVADYLVGGPSPYVGQGNVRCFNGATGSQRWIRFGDIACSELGWAVAAIDDVNGNGVPDVLAGDRAFNKIVCNGYGRVRVLEGADGTQIQLYTQSTAYAGLGQSLTSVGDIDGDGKPELAAGAPAADTPPVAANVRVLRVGSTVPLIQLAPADTSDHFGRALASGDANGDGLRDLIVGEPLADDNGTDSGTVHVYTFVRAPTVFCESETNSLGCTPAITGVGTPSATLAQVFDVRATSVLNNKFGLCFYGFKPRQTPFQGGHMCIVSPTVRTGVQSSGGNAPPTSDCSGVFTLDFNARIQSGVDPLLVAGEEVFAQYWSRDPADQSTTNLTDALAFYIGP